ncbi:uncharacterized protein L203_105434 [Cryptococcus depauperatus CBS 7841]|uniref:Uncharacterized protein n=1 Tax=Cryptococcus depauperatus CBS 7841 TaxID=1295531 RepID=A0AAJ8JXD7_9TREE
MAWMEEEEWRSLSTAFGWIKTKASWWICGIGPRRFGILGNYVADWKHFRMYLVNDNPVSRDLQHTRVVSSVPGHLEIMYTPSWQICSKL